MRSWNQVRPLQETGPRLCWSGRGAEGRRRCHRQDGRYCQRRSEPIWSPWLSYSLLARQGLEGQHSALRGEHLWMSAYWFRCWRSICFSHRVVGRRTTSSSTSPSTPRRSWGAGTAMATPRIRRSCKSRPTASARESSCMQVNISHPILVSWIPSSCSGVYFLLPPTLRNIRIPHFL